MKLTGIALVLAALIAVATGDTLTSLSDQQTFALTTIDQVPSSQQLADATLTVPDDLVAVAANVNGTYDTAVRLRAIRGLAVYCKTQDPQEDPCPDTGSVHVALRTLILANKDAHAGSDLLLLRAAIESDGPLKDSGDLDLLLPLLDHPSRDIRATTARALGDLCNTASTTVDRLRQRYQNESTDQVKLAISATLRILSQPTNCLVN